MNDARAGSVRASVFRKLLAVMLSMFVSQSVIITIFFLYVVDPNMRMSMDVSRQFGRVLASTSPAFETAVQLRDSLDVQTRYEGPRGGWTTADFVLTASDVLRGGEVPRNGVHRFIEGQDYYVEPSPDGGTYTFVWGVRRHWHIAHLVMFGMVLFLLVVVVWVAHSVLRRLLQPLRSLGDGVAQLGEGQFDVVLPIQSRDEFGVLTGAFNQMVRRIRDMVHARNQLLLDVSHELRSPVTRLKVALALLPDDERKAHMAADVEEMERMISELLELERLRDGRGIKTARQDIVPMLRDMADRFADRAPGCRFVSAAEEAWLDVDGEQLRTVFRNLLENAVKYSQPDSRAVALTLALAPSGDAVTIRVTDDGPGIPEADVSNLFEPFFRVDRSRSKKTGGYGLGLSICKRIIEAHGGTITAENNPVRGASFIVSLPRPGML